MQKYEESEIVVDDDQNDEMCQLMQKIGTDGLEALYKEGDQHGVRKGMEDIWVTDKERQRDEFTHDQATNSVLCNIVYNITYESLFLVGNSGRGNRWSMITIQMNKLWLFSEFVCSYFTPALAVYLRSPSVYEALKQFDILNLPAKSTLQSYTGEFIHDLGE